MRDVLSSTPGTPAEAPQIRDLGARAPTKSGDLREGDQKARSAGVLAGGGRWPIPSGLYFVLPLVPGSPPGTRRILHVYV